MHQDMKSPKHDVKGKSRAWKTSRNHQMRWLSCTLYDHCEAVIYLLIWYDVPWLCSYHDHALPSWYDPQARASTSRTLCLSMSESSDKAFVLSIWIVIVFLILRPIALFNGYASSCFWYDWRFHFTTRGRSVGTQPTMILRGNSTLGIC